MDAALRQEFLESADAFATIRITDYDIGTIDYESNDRASVWVTYRGYAVGTFVESPIRERQNWYSPDSRQRRLSEPQSTPPSK